MSNEVRFKYGLRVVDAKEIEQNPNRYKLKVDPPNPPLCPFGNPQKYVGYDNQTGEYVRLTKSVFKRFFRQLKEKNLLGLNQ